MTEDASLDDFLDAGDQQAEADERADDPDTGEAAEGPAGDSETKSTAPDDQRDATDDAGPTEATDVAEATGGEAADVDPATATYDWTPSGAACAACDAVVERRWRDDPGFVCESCKDW